MGCDGYTTSLGYPADYSLPEKYEDKLTSAAKKACLVFEVIEQHYGCDKKQYEAWEALRQALKEKQKPVAWTVGEMFKSFDAWFKKGVGVGRVDDAYEAGYMAGMKVTSPQLRELSDDLNDILISLSKEGYAPQLVYDDDGHWAVALESFGKIGSAPSTIIDEGLQWYDTPIEAARAVIKKAGGEG